MPVEKQKKTPPEQQGQAPAEQKPPILYQAGLRISPAAVSEGLGLLSKDFLGEYIYSIISASPPKMRKTPNAIFKLFCDSAAACYVGGGNILVRSLPTAHDDQVELVVHESLHYAASIGTGSIPICRFTDTETGKEYVIPYAKYGVSPWAWLHEGMTEFLAQDIVRSNGYKPTGVAYEYEVQCVGLIQAVAGNALVQEAVASGDFSKLEALVGKGAVAEARRTGDYTKLESLAGKAVLKNAYLSGDFNELARLIDSKLGPGTFKQLVMLRNGSEALELLRTKINQAVSRGQLPEEFLPSPAKMKKRMEGLFKSSPQPSGAESAPAVTAPRTRSEMLQSEDYLGAIRRVDELRAKIAAAKKPGLRAIEKEKAVFFNELKAKNPEVYHILEIEQKTLSEEIILKKRGGKLIILD